MEIVLKANGYAHRLFIWKEDGSLLKLGPVFSFTVKYNAYVFQFITIM